MKRFFLMFLVLTGFTFFPVSAEILTHMGDEFDVLCTGICSPPAHTHSYFFNSSNSTHDVFYNYYGYSRTSFLSLKSFPIIVNASIKFKGSPFYTESSWNTVQNSSFYDDSDYSYFTFNVVNTSNIVSSWVYLNASGVLTALNIRDFDSNIWKTLKFCSAACDLSEGYWVYFDWNNSYLNSSNDLYFRAYDSDGGVESPLNIPYDFSFNWTENSKTNYASNLSFYLNYTFVNSFNITSSDFSMLNYTTDWIEFTDELNALYSGGTYHNVDVPFTVQTDEGVNVTGYVDIDELRVEYFPFGGGYVPPITDVINKITIGGAFGAVLEAYNPSAYHALEVELYDWLYSPNLDNFLLNTMDVSALMVLYIFRQPATLIDEGGANHV